MAAGAGAGSGGSLESTLEHKFQSVTNTMDSIQGLSKWCIDNKKYHSLIVRHWIRCIKKANASHRLNLFYLANDVIQNCKRKNAIVYRTAFAEVLRDAFLLVKLDGDPAVIKAVERILTIWEERAVYSGTLIVELRNSLVKEESPPETPVEQKTPVESKAALQSRVVAEFVPQALMDKLRKYKRSMEEVDLREKQLAAMRVDICSSEALKKLKDKAGGKKFSKDFEEGSAQLSEFVKFLEKQCKSGPPLLEGLSHADIFYEMQYKEVKIVANAYQTFANRVTHLKRKLDSLKASLPDMDESPIPSPSADAPSPTGSESPFHGMAAFDEDLDGSAMDDDAPAPSPLSSPEDSPKAVGEDDNRVVEDMELSEEEMDGGGIIVEEHNQRPSTTTTTPTPSTTTTTTSSTSSALPEASTPVAAKPAPLVAAEQPAARVPAPAAPPAVAPVENVSLDKIGSLLNSLTSVMKNTAPVVESPPAAAVPSLRTPPVVPLDPPDTTSLVNILSQVDVSPADLLGALSKVQGQIGLDGISSLLSGSAPRISSDSSSSGKVPPCPPSSTPAAAAAAAAPPSLSPSVSSVAAPPPAAAAAVASPVPSSSVKPSARPPASSQTSNTVSKLVQALHRDTDLAPESEPSASSNSLESKIHRFLQGNSAFNAFDLGFPSQGSENHSPVAAPDTQDGTPVRDEGGGTPTQDEIMDKASSDPFTANANPPSSSEPFKMPLFQKSGQQGGGNPPQRPPGVAQNGQAYQPYPYGKHDVPEHGISAPVGHYQQIPAQTGGPTPGERAPGAGQTVKSFQGGGERGWYGDIYPEGNSQQPAGFSLPPGENSTSVRYPYQASQPQELASQQGATMTPAFLRNSLPPVPNLPPPPLGYDGPPPSSSGGSMVPQESMQPPPRVDPIDDIAARVDRVTSSLVFHDHQHKPGLHQEEPVYEPPHAHPPRPSERRYHEGPDHYQNEHHGPDGPYYQDDTYHHHHHQELDPFYRPGSPPHAFPRPQGRLSPPHSPSEDPYFDNPYQDNQWQRAPAPHYAPRRPPPHPDIRHPRMRPPLRPPHPQHHPQHPPRGPPRPPFPRFRGPDPRMRGKRPGPRGGGGVGGPPGPMFAPKRPFLPPRY